MDGILLNYEQLEEHRKHPIFFFTLTVYNLNFFHIKIFLIRGQIYLYVDYGLVIELLKHCHFLANYQKLGGLAFYSYLGA